MRAWLRRRRIAKAIRWAKADEQYARWREGEIARYGHVRSYDETQGWCIADDCFKTVPHLPHG